MFVIYSALVFHLNSLLNPPASTHMAVGSGIDGGGLDDGQSDGGVTVTTIISPDALWF